MASFGSSKYEHVKLRSSSSIRLLELLPGTYGDELRCRIRQRELQNAGSYGCVSYVWGDISDRPHMMICNEGESGNFGSLPIPRNLDLALRRFRLEDGNLSIWVDSICIDQENTEERNGQVKIMGQIYTMAGVVLIWLGEESDTGQAEAAVRCMNLLAQNVVENIDYIEKTSSTGLFVNEAYMHSNSGGEQPESDDLHRRLGIPLLASKEFASFGSLTCNSWFTRAWTWQESVVAKKRMFFWSNQCWGSRLILDALRLILTLGEVTGNPLYWYQEVSKAITMIAGKDIWKVNRQYLTLQVLLEQQRGAGCKYASDQVYSLIGVAEQCPDLTVDYDASFSETFARTTFLVMQHTKSLGILVSIEHPRLDADLPSWVPDWRNKDTHRVAFTKPWCSFYAATGCTTARVKLSSDARILQVAGIAFEQIRETKIPASDIVGWISDRLESGTPQDPRYQYTDETAEQVRRRTTLLDNISFDPTRPEKRSGADIHNMIDHIVADRDKGEQGRAVYGALDLRMQWSTTGMIFFTTYSGHVGLAHCTAKAGDEIVFLCGAEAPILLRCSGEGSETYQYVAECYVHGFMDGEAFVEARRAANPDEEVTDISWLNTIGDGELPFPLKEFQIV